jgi:hypothetical protein
VNLKARGLEAKIALHCKPSKTEAAMEEEYNKKVVGSG